MASYEQSKSSDDTQPKHVSLLDEVVEYSGAKAAIEGVGALGSAIGHSEAYKAFGHMFDDTPSTLPADVDAFAASHKPSAPTPELPGYDSDDYPRWAHKNSGVDKAAVEQLKSQYLDFDAKGNLPPGVVAPNDQKVDLSDPQARLATLNQLTQQTQYSTGNGGDYSHDACAASSLVGAAIIGGGNDGLVKLMNGMDNDDGSKEAAARIAKLEEKGGDLYNLRQKLKNNEQLTMADMHLLQRNLYSELHDDDVELKNGDRPGLSQTAQQHFLDNAAGMRTMMHSQGLNIAEIDTTGEGKSNHAVLEIGHNAIYDPWMRKEGQVVTDENQLHDYEAAKYGELKTRS